MTQERRDVATMRLAPDTRRMLNIVAAYTGETQDQVINRLLQPEVASLQQQAIKKQEQKGDK